VSSGGLDVVFEGLTKIDRRAKAAFTIGEREVCACASLAPAPCNVCNLYYGVREGGERDQLLNCLTSQGGGKKSTFRAGLDFAKDGTSYFAREKKKRKGRISARKGLGTHSVSRKILGIPVAEEEKGAASCRGQKESFLFYAPGGRKVP